MALFRNVGPLTTITPGATHYWRYWFTPLADVGVACVTPNLQEEAPGIRLIAFDNGVTLDIPNDEGGARNVYTVSIRYSGPWPIFYNLNTGYLS